MSNETRNDLLKFKDSKIDYSKLIQNPDDSTYNLRTLIITNNQKMADEFFNRTFEISKDNILKYSVDGNQRHMEFENGEHMDLITQKNSSLGSRCTELIIDENIDLNYLRTVLLPLAPFGKISILQDEIYKLSNN